MSTPYTVKYGDTLVLIAKRHGLASWREIYYLDPDNREFRGKRPNPDKIYPGDVVMIPDNRPGTTPPDEHEYTGFTTEHPARTAREAVAEAKRLLDVVVRRLDFDRIIFPRAVLLDTKLKVYNVFKVNMLTALDMALPGDFPDLPRLVFPAVPDGVDIAINQMRFTQLKLNFGRIRRGLDEFFRKVYHPPGTEPRCALYGAFVVPGAPWDPTMHFCPLFYSQHTDDRHRAGTVAHERAHTVLRAPEHPGTSGDRMFCVLPHMGIQGQSYEQAIENPYNYEWLTFALQRDYNYCSHVGIECGYHECATGEPGGAT